MFVGEVEVAERANGDIEVDRVDIAPKQAAPLSAFQYASEDVGEGSPEIRDPVGMPEMLRAVGVKIAT